MPSEKTPAIVLRTVEFSETSLIVTLFTREFGKISALAKGARRPKGPFESALDLLALVRIVFLRKSSDVLDLLTEAKLDRRFRAGARDLNRLYAGFYVAELLAELTDTHDPHPELFDAADQSLLALDGQISPATAVLWLELTALSRLGHLPTLDVCAACSREVEVVDRVPFGLLAGGLLCAACRSGQRQVVSVRAEIIGTMQRFLDATMDWRELVIPVDQRGELRGLLNNYLNHLMGHRSRLQSYLNGLTAADRGR
ncbi:DNA repair protein RecO [Anatilimnocola aggregata]|uniref:DNA repair protein RecO n=1 Tax=Anatilimnocola aggregata TaxID=2528021 RepID=A0A517Y4S2_9BACT|nr:DNA repair protein RecO [Anatilimnocola aggregata]QDU25237.1 DNA repair protein RecO [Anatilimnocola aggregata]